MECVGSYGCGLFDSGYSILDETRYRVRVFIVITDSSFVRPPIKLAYRAAGFCVVHGNFCLDKGV